MTSQVAHPPCLGKCQTLLRIQSCSPLVTLTAKLSWQNSRGHFGHMLLTAAAATKQGPCLFHSALLEALEVQGWPQVWHLYIIHKCYIVTWCPQVYRFLEIPHARIVCSDESAVSFVDIPEDERSCS